MEECNKRKRLPSNSPDSEPESKIPRLGLGSDFNSSDSELVRVDSCVNSYESELTRVDSGELCFNSDIQDDIFNILDSENVAERDSAIQGLDSVIKSFEEEIFAPRSGLDPVDSKWVPDCGELQTNLNLGYLLEASDDELGLPPAAAENNEPDRVDPDEVDLTGFMGFDDIPNPDAFGFGNELVAECDGDNGGAGAFSAKDGLFDYAETADIMWRTESV